MSGVNPVVLIQLMMTYHQMEHDLMVKGPGNILRTFAFQKNGRMRVHKETPEEYKRRKSMLTINQCRTAEKVVRKQLGNALKGRTGKVWIDPKLQNLAVPLETATGNSGFGVLPTGSRAKIPEGKFIRAFTYWEKVNDIDLSVFGLTEDGRQEEFSWRNMYAKQGSDITYSGDQTSGFNGGSEYFDINIEAFKKSHPTYRYLIFCNNVYSGINFSQCDCKAGFMVREENPEKVLFWKGQRNDLDRVSPVQPVIFDPRTVETSYTINAEGTFAYLFGIDLKTREMIWLNVVRSDRTTVAGGTDMSWLRKYLTITDVFSLKDLYAMAGELTEQRDEAKVIVSDNIRWNEADDETIEVVRSWDFEKMLSLLKAG